MDESRDSLFAHKEMNDYSHGTRFDQAPKPIATSAKI